MKKTIVFCLLFWGLYGMGNTSSSNYKLVDFPKSELGCHNTAQAVGEEFQKKTGANVIRSICWEETEAGYQIEITYKAELPLLGVSTDVVFGVDGAGRYATRKECAKNLRKETLLFEEQTKLEPVFHYCRREPVQHTFEWFPFIQGFGDSDIKPQISGFHFFGIVENLTKKDFTQALEAALLERELTFTGLVVRSYLAYGRMTIHYYGKEAFNFTLKEYTRTDKAGQCKRQIGQAKEILAGSTNEPVIIYCGRVDVGLHWELTTLFIEGEPFSTGPSAESFKKFGACERNRLETIRYYQEVLERPVQGGLCSRVDQKYRIILFEDY